TGEPGECRGQRSRFVEVGRKASNAIAEAILRRVRREPATFRAMDEPLGNCAADEAGRAGDQDDHPRDCSAACYEVAAPARFPTIWNFAWSCAPSETDSVGAVISPSTVAVGCTTTRPSALTRPVTKPPMTSVCATMSAFTWAASVTTRR